MRRSIVLISTTALALALIGCDKGATVDEDKSRPAFINDVEMKLGELDTRIAKVKSDADGRSESVQVTLHNATEMAEEKIETIRDTQIPALQSAEKPDAIAQAKSDINQSLTEAADEVARAEKALKDAKSDREKYTEQARAKLDQLRKDLADVRSKAGNLSDDAKARIRTLGESIEESIDEGGSTLDRYADASADQAGQLKGEFERLLKQGQDKLSEARDAIEKAMSDSGNGTADEADGGMSDDHQGNGDADGM